MTNRRFSRDRAKIAWKLVQLSPRENIPVFCGKEEERKLKQKRFSQEPFTEDIDFQAEGLSSSLDFFRELESENLYCVSLGCPSNADFLLRNLLEWNSVRFFIMGGSLSTDYHGENKTVPEWNLRSNIQASRRVFRSEADITMVGLDCTWNLELWEQNMERIRKSKRPMNRALNRLHTYWKRHHQRRNLILYDPFTVAVLIYDSLAHFRTMTCM